MLPLSHIRVLDLSRVLAGPWVTQSLGDLGAEVVKIERPNQGDDTRTWGPPYVKDPSGKSALGESAYFLCCNRNKKSVTVDLASKDGQQIVRRLAQESDVLVENFKAGSLKSYGLSFQDLREINPDLIYCSITGFGQNGPKSHIPGYDFAIQAMGGLMSVTGPADGDPQKVGVAVVDLMTGMYAKTAILSALIHRDVDKSKCGKRRVSSMPPTDQPTGGPRGQHLDISLFDVQCAMLINQASNYLVSGKIPKKMGNAHPNIAPYDAVPTADGLMVLAVGNDTQFRDLCKVLGCAELALDPRFSKNPSRVAHRQELLAALDPHLKKGTRKEWTEKLGESNVPCGPINNIAEVFEEAQVAAREMLWRLSHPHDPSLPVVGNPIKFSLTQIHKSDHHTAPPLLGQHTDEVLREVLGMELAEIEDLRRRKIV